MTHTTQTAKVLEAFRNGEELTGKQIAHRFSVGNPRAVVNKLRSAGYSIYLNKRTDTKGRVKFKYRLGTPTRAIVAAGIAALGAQAAGLV
jgi:Helix-turn-helix domain